MYAKMINHFISIFLNNVKPRYEFVNNNFGIFKSITFAKNNEINFLHSIYFYFFE